MTAQRPLRLVEADPGSEGRGAKTPQIGSWLELLTSLLPEAERAGVREELESHLSDRVRDLMLTGMSEVDATRQAIAELGDAALLAHRFRQAIRPSYRRRVMNIATLGVAGVALVTGVIALSSRGPEAAKPGEPETERFVAQFDALQGAKEGPEIGALDLKETLLADALELVAKGAKAQLFVRWSTLESLGILRDTQITARTGKVDVAGAFAAISEGITDSGERPGRLDYRLKDGVLEVASTDYFDRRETTLVSHDIGPIVGEGGAGISGEDLVKAIEDLVEPISWRDNGGDKAMMRILGSKLLVQAPPRMQRQVEWILKELGATSVSATDFLGDRAAARPLLLDLAMRRQETTDLPILYAHRIAALTEAPCTTTTVCPDSSGQFLIRTPDGQEIRCDRILIERAPAPAADSGR